MPVGEFKLEERLASRHQQTQTRSYHINSRHKRDISQQGVMIFL
jgi:hypothetical protein